MQTHELESHTLPMSLVIINLKQLHVFLCMKGSLLISAKLVTYENHLTKISFTVQEKKNFLLSS